MNTQTNKPESNYFLVNRGLLNSDRWLSEPFTRGQAWVDLFGLAQHTKGFFRVRGIRVDVDRGQLAYSQVTLAQRWQWSRDKVRRYLKELETAGDIIQQNNEVTTLITVIKYNQWQGDNTTNDTANRQQTDSRKTANDTHKKNDNNDNKYSKSNDLPHTPLEDLVYEPLKGVKSKGAFLNRERSKKGKPRMLKTNPRVWDVINKYRRQYQYITGKVPIVSDADYFHVESVSKKISPDDMDGMIVWYVKKENKKFMEHPGLKSIFTPENINKYNLR